MLFQPIAIVGQSCTLPEAPTPAALWTNVLAGRSLVSAAPADRWRMPRADAMGTVDAWSDRTWSDAGGYVRGFDRAFDASGFAISAEVIAQLDPVFQWTLHGVREALRDAGHLGSGARAGLVMGNLSFPSSGMVRFAESVWLGGAGSPFAAQLGLPPHPYERFSSGLPAHLAARALGLGAGAFALDAACASSLYAIKLACDRLHDGSADVMVAGAVNRADDLFIHIGFCALSAMSRTGRSRPFHRGADGLVPAEGAGFVVLRRLQDAVASGQRILGVIRGVGLSNDGRGRGLLAPSEEGQERALRLAYASAGLSPRDVGLIECHATGTPVGDATEVRSMSRVFAGCEGVPIGSLKSNMGHLITAAGVAGLLKVLASMNAATRPPTLYADDPIDALGGTPFRLLTQAEPWDGPRRAGISAFGFGGTNAHLIVEAWEGTTPAASHVAAAPADRVAIVGLGARVGRGEGAADLARDVLGGTSSPERRETVAVALDGLRFPPRDLQQALAQQSMLLEAAREAASGLSLPRDRTSVVVGMGCDPEIARYGVRWRLGAWAGALTPPPADEWIARSRDAFHEKLEAAGVVGTMPNIPASRVSSQLDLGGPGFTVSSEEASGIVALRLCARALLAGEIDAAIVGAVDLSCEPVHAEALRALGRDRVGGDAAIALVLKRESDARRDGDAILAVIGDDEGPRSIALGPGGLDLGPRLGHAHAAHGLVQVAAAALALRHGARPRDGAAAVPDLGARAAHVEVDVTEAPSASLRLEARDAIAWLPDAAPRFHVYSGADRAGALASLAVGRSSGQGPARLVIVASDLDELRTRSDQARRWLDGGGPAPEGVAFREAPTGGQLAFVFTGAAAAYAGMGRELALATPDLTSALRARSAEICAATGWLYGEGDGKPTHPLDQLWGTSFVCQLHAELTRGVLGIRPDATIGYSSGESNALFAMGAWTDLDAMIRDSRASALFQSDLVGAFEAPRRAWARLGASGSRWANFNVAASVSEVNAALAGEPLAHLTIVNSDDDCVIGGEAAACGRVVDRLGRDRAIALGYDIAAHCPEVEEVRDAWRSLHRRPTTDVAGVRFYTNATGTWLRPTPDAAADAITGQAIRTLDFRRVVEQAYADGVRVFVEHGPRGLCSGWIRRILGDRDHLAVALDAQGRSGVRQALHAVAWLVAAGVPVDADALLSRLTPATTPTRTEGKMLTLQAHPPEPRLAALAPEAQRMHRAPTLPSVLSEAPPTFGVAPAAAPAAAPAPAALPESAAAVRAADAPSAPSPMPFAASSPGASALADDALGRLSAYQARLATMHRDFLSEQAAVHQQFLALRQVAEARLLSAITSPRSEPAAARVVAPEPAPAAHVPAVTAAPARLAAPPVAPVSSPSPLPVAPVAPAVPVAPAAPAAPVAPVAARVRPGPKFDRAQLEVLASGRISSVFGSMFEPQDGYARQVRMPEPPLLLADRVTGIEAVAGSMGTGTLWTETDVLPGSWYLNDEGRMPPGIMIESGQADLLLISWLGVDLLNRGERVYRLLGCELTYHASLPTAGETLAYDIHVDGHAAQGDVRLFFFHYDCHVGAERRLSVRHGQAGFFTDEELANSAGVLWDCAEEPAPGGAVDAPEVVTERRGFDADALRAFAEGRPHACFGAGWERTRTHVRTPKITKGRTQFLREVTEFDPRGGPWGRGYLRAETPVSPDDWFFAGHFKNDPCMPGTLMFDGCLQAMAVYLAALGCTIERDGWRFEPVPDEKYAMRCRGQVTPSSRHLVYEVFVSEFTAGPIPTLFADLLCTVDGRKAFHARRVGLRLVPDWPLTHWRQLGPHASQISGAPLALRAMGGLRNYVEAKPVATVDGFAFDFASLLACAWGRPSEAFGPMYAPFDGARRVARLPGPPYHFMSRVTNVSGPIGGMQSGSAVEVEYDLPDSQWYFEQNGNPTMPFCVLMEAALQPCGWLASYVGSALTTDTELLFRNLDGTGTLVAELLPGGGTLRTCVKLTSISSTAGMIIQSFAVECFLADRRVFEMKTVFGFFPKEAFENQVGLPVSPDERARIDAPAVDPVDLTTRPARYFEGSARLPKSMLLVLGRVIECSRTGGRFGLGYARAEATLDPDVWFFKAHFFQDPVQPGSLGIEAMCQLLQFAMIERDMGEGLAHPRFEPVMLERPVTWKYRGQVVPRNRVVTTEVEITEVGSDARGPFLVAEAWLWVDGKRIYHAKNLGMRMVEGDPPPPRSLPLQPAEVLDPARDSWLADHCPTWTLPALPMMSMVDRLAQAATDGACGYAGLALRDVQVKRWLPFPAGAIALQTTIAGEGDERQATLLAWRDASDPRLSRFEPVAEGHVRTGCREAAPAPFAALGDATAAPDPYASGSLFHGAAFQYLTELRMGSRGASGTLRAERGSVPRGALHQGLLDAATHVIPHTSLSQWSPEIPDSVVGYPYRLRALGVFEPLPDAGDVQVEARFAGFDGDARFPCIDLQLLVEGRVHVAMRLVEVLLPKGRIGAAAPADRRAFLRDRRHVQGVSLARHEGATTRLSEAELRGSDWLPGNVARIYGVDASAGGDLLEQVAMRAHVADRAFVHPSRVTVEPGATSARARMRPLRLHQLTVTREASEVSVTDARPATQDLAEVSAYWRDRIGVGAWPVEDLYYGLVSRFVGDVVVADPDAFAAVRGRSCLYLANHQTGVESLLFSMLASALSGTPTVTLAKAEHRTSWLGRLIAHCFAYPGVTDPRLITFFDREDRESLVQIVGALAAEMSASARSVMVHVEGTRALSARQPVEKMSSAFIDMALSVGAPIVPVRFVGGLPVAALETRLEFPLGFGRQDYWIGRPILPEQLAQLPYKERKAAVIAAINGLGPALAAEAPFGGDAAFAAAVEAWIARTGATPEDAVLMTTLASRDALGDGARALVEGARTGTLVVGDDPREQWLGALASRLYGPRGPAIVPVRQPASSGA